MWSFKMLPVFMDNKLEKIMKTQQPCKSCSQLLLNTCSSKNNFDQSQRKCFDAQNSESTDLNAWEPLLCLTSKGYFKWVPEQWLIQTHILLPFSLFNTCFFYSLKVKQRSEKWVTEKRNASAMWCWMNSGFSILAPPSLLHFPFYIYIIPRNI